MRLVDFFLLVLVVFFVLLCNLTFINYMQQNISKSAMHGGLILGVLFSLNFLLSITKITSLALLTYVIAIFIVIVMYKLSVRFRDKDCEGAITYSRALIYVQFTFFFAALISTIVKFTYFQFINTTYLETMFQETMKAMEMMKFPMDDASVSQVQSMLKPATFSMIYIFTNLFLGTIVGLIMAAFVKKDKDIFSQQ